eukprot:1649270-Prymnesium_polylepis.1
MVRSDRLKITKSTLNKNHNTTKHKPRLFFCLISASAVPYAILYFAHVGPGLSGSCRHERTEVQHALRELQHLTQGERVPCVHVAQALATRLASMLNQMGEAGLGDAVDRLPDRLLRGRAQEAGER